MRRPSRGPGSGGARARRRGAGRGRRLCLALGAAGLLAGARGQGPAVVIVAGDGQRPDLVLRVGGDEPPAAVFDEAGGHWSRAEGHDAVATCQAVFEGNWLPPRPSNVIEIRVLNAGELLVADVRRPPRRDYTVALGADGRVVAPPRQEGGGPVAFVPLAWQGYRAERVRPDTPETALQRALVTGSSTRSTLLATGAAARVVASARRVETAVTTARGAVSESDARRLSTGTEMAQAGRTILRGTTAPGAAVARASKAETSKGTALASAGGAASKDTRTEARMTGVETAVAAVRQEAAGVRVAGSTDAAAQSSTSEVRRVGAETAAAVTTERDKRLAPGGRRAEGGTREGTYTPEFPFRLLLAADRDAVHPGEPLELSATWKNESKETLFDPRICISLPRGMGLVKAHTGERTQVEVVPAPGGAVRLEWRISGRFEPGGEVAVRMTVRCGAERSAAGA